MWTAAYGGNEIEQGYSVCEITNSGYAIAGYTDSYGSGNGDFYLLRTNEDGDTLWTKTFGGNQWEYALSIQSSSDGGYIITGYTESYGQGNGDVYLVKTAEDPANVNEELDHKPLLNNLRIFISPNPFTTVTSFKFIGTNKKIKYNLTIYDASGRLVKSVKLTTNSCQLGADLVPGIYFLKLKVGECTETKKIIKIR